MVILDLVVLAVTLAIGTIVGRKRGAWVGFGLTCGAYWLWAAVAYRLTFGTMPFVGVYVLTIVAMPALFALQPVVSPTGSALVLSLGYWVSVLFVVAALWSLGTRGRSSAPR
jgi:hypothetical protein